MATTAERLQRQYFGRDEHPYLRFQREVAAALRPEHTLLDAGCGRGAPVLKAFLGKAARLIGVDAVDFVVSHPGIELRQADLSKIDLPDASVDIIMARSVIEHITDPTAVYAEFCRVLKPGGLLLFLTANMWDYASLIAAVIPNRFHQRIVRKVSGREMIDTFPTAYKSNTRRSIRRFAKESGLRISHFEYLGQYPCYFMFNGALFMLASAYEKLIAAFKPLHFLRGWIFCIMEKPVS